MGEAMRAPDAPLMPSLSPAKKAPRLGHSLPIAQAGPGRAEGIDVGEIVHALTIRAVGIWSPRTSSTGPDAGAGGLDATFAIARALGRCGTDDAENTLAAWLYLPDRRASLAALAIGDIAS